MSCGFFGSSTTSSTGSDSRGFGMFSLSIIGTSCSKRAMLSQFPSSMRTVFVVAGDSYRPSNAVSWDSSFVLVSINNRGHSGERDRIVLTSRGITSGAISASAWI